MKFRYYLFFKNNYYHLFDRKLKKDIATTITFYSIYCFIKENKINDTDVMLKRVSLYTLFRDYCSRFSDDKEVI